MECSSVFILRTTSFGERPGAPRYLITWQLCHRFHSRLLFRRQHGLLWLFLSLLHSESRKVENRHVVDSAIHYFDKPKFQLLCLHSNVVEPHPRDAYLFLGRLFLSLFGGSHLGQLQHSKGPRICAFRLCVLPWKSEGPGKWRNVSCTELEEVKLVKIPVRLFQTSYLWLPFSIPRSSQYVFALCLNMSKMVMQLETELSRASCRFHIQFPIESTGGIGTTLLRGSADFWYKNTLFLGQRHAVLPGAVTDVLSLDTAHPQCP